MTVTAILALAVHDQAVFTQAKAQFLGFFVLTLFDDFVLKLDDEAAFDADHVVVVIAAFQLEYGMATFKMVAAD